MTPEAPGAAQPAAHPAASESFPTWRILLWCLGGVGNTVIGSLTGLLTYFYVPPETSQAAFPAFLPERTVFGLTSIGLVGYAGGLLAFFLGPLVSSWSDRSRARMGRRKAFMAVSFIPVAVFSWLLFTPPVAAVSELNVAWLLGVVILLNLFRSLYGVSTALVPELGVTSRIIMSFGTFGAIGWLMGFIVGSQAVFVIKDALMGAGMSALDAFRTTVGGLIAVSAALSALQVIVVDERRYCSGKASGARLLPALRKALSNRTFVLFVLTQQVYLWGDGLFQLGLVYFVTILFGLPETMMLVFGGTMVGISLVLYPLVNLAAKRISKKLLFSAALLAMVVVVLMIWASPAIPLPRATLAWLIVILSAIPNGITGIIPGAIGNEIVREDCVRTGEPNEATFGAAAGMLTAIPAGFPGLVAPSLLILGKSAAHPDGVRLLSLVCAASMLLAFLMLAFTYDERKVRASLRKHGYR